MLREKFPRNVIRRQSPQEDFFVSFFCLFFSYYYFSALSSRSSAAENKVKCGGEGDGDPMVVSSPIPPRPGAHKRRARLWKRWRQNSGSDRNKEPIHRLTSTNSAESEWERKGWREAEGEKEREGDSLICRSLRRLASKRQIESGHRRRGWVGGGRNGIISKGLQYIM